MIFLALAYSFGELKIPGFEMGNLFPKPTSTDSGQVVINDYIFNVEVSDDASERGKGLGGKESLASDSGMLFLFPKADKYPFWMKGLRFSLDFIYISNNEVVDIIKNAMPPTEGQPDDQLPIYVPAVPVDRVLEVNGGVIDNLNIRIGDKVEVIRN